MKTWVEISRRRLIANYKLLQEAAGPETAVLAVVKANAYGHTSEICGVTLAHAGACWLGVADAQEAVALRKALIPTGIQSRIVVMSPPSREEMLLFFEHDLTPVVWLPEHIRTLSAVAKSSNGPLPIPIHLEIDTGMSRQGIAPGPGLDSVLTAIRENPRVYLEGVLTHFACAEVPKSPQTQSQRRLFEQAIASIRSSGLPFHWLHAGSSSTLDTADAEQNLAWLTKLAVEAKARPMVRSGIALYGYCLPLDQTHAVANPKIQSELQPVLTWKTRILALRDISAGDTVGYNATFTAERAMRLALLPIGYADGLRRELSSTNVRSGGWVMVRGGRAPIVGRISMNLTTVDVTHISAACAGDEVTVLGDGVTADDHARFAGTISYEILCGVRAPAQLIDD